MDLTIWKQIIVKWINCLEPPFFVGSSGDIGFNVIEEILNVLMPNHGQSVDSFINDVFPNYCLMAFASFTDFDYLCICTLILVFVCFSNKNELDWIRQKMCMKLENSEQEYVTDFLTSIQKYEDVFKINEKIIKEEILKFSKRHNLKNCARRDENSTPVKSFNVHSGLESPLLEFFQTPNEKFNRSRSSDSSYCNTVQQCKIKKLTDELTEAEHEKLLLEEDLKLLKARFNDNETRLKCKTEEVKQLQEYWGKEGDNHERRERMLSLTIVKNLEDKRRICDKIASLESYVTSLQEELSRVAVEKYNLQGQIKCAVNAVERNAEEIRILHNKSEQLENAVKRLEGEVLLLKEDGARALQTELRSSTLMSRLWDDAFDCTPVYVARNARNMHNLLEESTVLGGAPKQHKTKDGCNIKGVFSCFRCFHKK